MRVQAQWFLLCLALLLQVGVFVAHRRTNRLAAEENVDENDVTMLRHFSQRRHKKRLQTRDMVGDVAQSKQGKTLKHNPASLQQRANDKPPRQRQNQQRLLVHLHIGKNGGSSMDIIGPRLARKSNRKFVGKRHFDWSFIDKLAERSEVDVITMLRHPVQRAKSHYYFSQTLPWTRKRAMRNMTLTEYLNNTHEMLKTRGIWMDGQGAVRWLTGTHTANFVGIDKNDIPRREQVAKNVTEMCMLAADRLDETLWFGILEDLDRSMELLQHALGLRSKPTFPMANTKRQVQPMMNEWEVSVLTSLLPQDLWLYEYGKRLFEARYQAMKTGEQFVPPERPPLPQEPLSCASTPTTLECFNGPLKGFYEHSGNSKNQTIVRDDKIRREEGQYNGLIRSKTQSLHGTVARE